LIAAKRAKGYLDASYYINIMANQGRTITIVEGSADFLFCRDSTVGHPSDCTVSHAVWDVSHIWNWYVTFHGDSSNPDTKMEDMLTQLKPAHTNCIFNYV
jgi:uncharacterized protein YmfQ (DUF2313 family)